MVKRTMVNCSAQNFTSKAVMEAIGSCMTNKYSEGLPHQRYDAHVFVFVTCSLFDPQSHDTCTFVDQVLL